MTTAGPSDFGRRPDLMGPPELEKSVKAATMAKLEAMHLKVGANQMKQFQESTQDWMKRISTSPAYRQALQATDRATLASVPLLPQSTQGRWLGHLSALKNFGNRGDPLQTLRYISNIGDDIYYLQTLQVIGNEREQRGAREVAELLRQWEAAIGPAHPGHTIVDRYRERNPRISGQARNVLATGVFLIAASAAIFTGLLALFSKPDERQWKVFGIWATIALLAAGFGDITRGGPERLQGQVDFLVQPGGEWERLQMGGPGNPAYGLRDGNWSSFFRRLYDRGTHSPDVVAALRATGRMTDAQRKAILALAPPAIHPQLTAMLDSGGGAQQGADFRRMLGQLNHARTQEAQNIVVGYTQSGASRDTLAMFAKARAGTVAPPPPPVGFGSVPVV